MAFLGKQVNSAICDQNNLIGFFLIRLDVYLGLMDAGKEPDNELVPEALLARIEEVLEATNEPAENLVDQLSLHLGCQLLIQFKFFDDQVVIVMEGVTHCKLDRLA